jgi:hypothetical protein
LGRPWEDRKKLFLGQEKMAVQDLEEFKQWDEAASKVALRQMMFDKVKKSHPESHRLYQHAKSELEKAEAHLAEIQSKL